MYWHRQITKHFEKARKSFPAVLITGPRQSGKTTFLKHVAKDCSYISFDDPLERSFASKDPNGFLDRLDNKPVILDEVQYVPELFSYIKMRIDANRDKCGQYLMTGSQQFHMMKHVSDSLAGRLAILDLLPMVFKELPDVNNQDISSLIWQGGYPSIHIKPDSRDIWFSSYLQTYIERDVRQLQNIKNLNIFEHYIQQCVARHAQLVNYASLSKIVGVSKPTIKEWENILQASYILYLLQPYYNNYGKRFIKAPKLYFIDSGLASWLMRQPSQEGLWSGAAGGAFFEGWIILETLKCFANFIGHRE